MPKKLMIENIRNAFGERGYKLLESEYINNKQKLSYICQNGHRNNITWSDFKRGRGCPDCAKKIRADKQRLDIEFIKKEFSKKRFELLETKYINNKQKLHYKCPNGHINKITWGDFKAGNGCPDCAKITRANKQKLDIEFVKQKFNEYGFELLEDEYINNATKMKYKCSNGHINEITFDKLQQGRGCPDCSGNKKHTLEEIKMAFNERNYKLLSTEYKGAHEKLKYECDQGHINEITWANFQSGYGCPICGFQRARETMYKNQTVPTSKQQLYLHQLLKGELNYPVDNSHLDIAFINEKIFLEYDGGGHWIKVKYGDLTQEEFNQKERRRWYTLKNKGWREIRIISKQDKIPSDEKILELVQFAKDYLNTGHSWIHIDIDNSEIRCSQFTKKVDLGKLRKLD